MVVAGPGYGKTALVAKFLQELGGDSVWYSLDAADRDPLLFFRYLVQGIREQAADFGERSEEAFTELRPSASDVERLVDVFVSEAEEVLGGRLTVVLDGIHHLEASAPCVLALRRLLTYIPGTLHLILVGRSLPEIGIRPLEAEGSILTIGDPDLRFTLEETRALLAETLALNLPEGAAERIHSRTRGWVTALQLLRQTARLRGDAGSIPEDVFARTETEIFDYFSEEVLDSEPAGVREFLLASSLPEFIEPDICREVLAGSDVPGILERLRKRHLFVSPLESRTQYFAYDPLFRDFLGRKLLAERGAKARRDLDAAYGRAFAHRGAFPEALAHGVAAEDAQGLLDLLRQQGHALLRAGTLAAVSDAARFVASRGVKAAIVDDLLGEAARLSGDYPSAAVHFERALEARGPDGEHELRGTARANALQGLAYALMRRGESGRAATIAEEALGDAGEEDPALVARILNTLSIIRYRENRFQEAIRGWQQGLDRARQAGDRHLVLMIAHNLGLPHAVTGDLKRASECFQILTGPDNPHVGPQEGAAYLNLVRIATIRGEFTRASLLLGDAAEIARKLRLPSLAADVLEAEGNLLRESGDFAASAERYARARRLFTELGQTEVVRNIDEESAILAARNGSFDEAEDLGSSVVAQWKELDDPEGMASSLLALGEIRVRAGRAEEALAPLSDSAERYATLGRSYQEFLARLWLAFAFFKTGDTDEAKAAAARAIALAARFDYRAPLMRVAGLDEGFLELLGGIEKAPAYLAQPASRTEAARAARPTPHARKAADLTVRLLGPIEVFRDAEKKIPAAAWKIRRSLEMFCFLASSRNRRASKDRLMDALWANARPSVIEKNFHPTISFLRRALNHGHRISKNFILFERGAYLLNPAYRYEIDTESFEEGVRTARGRVQRGDPEGAIAAFTEALGLYSGPFMEENYSDWVEIVRTNLETLRRSALKELSDLHLQSGDPEIGIARLRETLALDPLDEAASARLIRALGARADRSGVEVEWRRLTSELSREAGARPTLETRRIYEAALKRPSS